MNFREDWKWMVPLAVVCVLVYANSLTGTFVYDDVRQILRNPLIQDNSSIWKALTSDVWAFKGDGSIAASNYWRPTFTAWHIINFRLFGSSPIGWHIANLVLHMSICVLIFGLLRRWAFSAMIAFTIALIFTVHPVHVESVAWISGSPDLLFTLAFLSSLWFAETYAETGEINSLVGTIMLYAIALGAKEIGIVCLPIFYLVFRANESDKKKPVNLRSTMLLLCSVAVVWFLLRWKVLGAISMPPEDAVTLGNALLSLPEMFAFYLRQIFFPYTVAASYPIGAVTSPGVSDFVLPLIVSIAAIAGLLYCAVKTKRGVLAAAMFILPLITTLNATVFNPEHLVQDRYLYLPLLGVLMLIVPFAAGFVGERNILFAGIVVSLILSAQTISYNRAWANNLAIWTWTTRVDTSSFAAMEYGTELSEAGRYDDAISAFSASINKRPTPRGYLGRARALLQKEKYADAERDLKTVLQFPKEKMEAYALYQTYEALGILYSRQGNYDAAVQNFTAARERLPIYSAALTCNLAIVLYQQGHKDDALRELENARTQAKSEMLPESKSVLLRLGMLYAERGRRDEAKVAIREYLDMTSTYTDKITLDERAQAVKTLDQIK